MIRDEDEKVSRLAFILMTANGHLENAKFKMRDGVEVPLWVTFVSRARELVREQEAVLAVVSPARQQVF